MSERVASFRVEVALLPDESGEAARLEIEEILRIEGFAPLKVSHL